MLVTASMSLLIGALIVRDFEWMLRHGYTDVSFIAHDADECAADRSKP